MENAQTYKPEERRSLSYDLGRQAARSGPLDRQLYLNRVKNSGLDLGWFNEGLFAEVKEVGQLCYGNPRSDWLQDSIEESTSCDGGYENLDEIMERMRRNPGFIPKYAYHNEQN